MEACISYYFLLGNTLFTLLELEAESWLSLNPFPWLAKILEVGCQQWSSHLTHWNEQGEELVTSKGSAWPLIHIKWFQNILHGNTSAIQGPYCGSLQRPFIIVLCSHPWDPAERNGLYCEILSSWFEIDYVFWFNSNFITVWLVSYSSFLF